VLVLAIWALGTPLMVSSYFRSSNTKNYFLALGLHQNVQLLLLSFNVFCVKAPVCGVLAWNKIICQPLNLQESFKFLLLLDRIYLLLNLLSPCPAWVAWNIQSVVPTRTVNIFSTRHPQIVSYTTALSSACVKLLFAAHNAKITTGRRRKIYRFFSVPKSVFVARLSLQKGKSILFLQPSHKGRAMDRMNITHRLLPAAVKKYNSVLGCFTFLFLVRTEHAAFTIRGSLKTRRISY